MLQKGNGYALVKGSAQGSTRMGVALYRKALRLLWDYSETTLRLLYAVVVLEEPWRGRVEEAGYQTTSFRQYRYPYITTCTPSSFKVSPAISG